MVLNLTSLNKAIGQLTDSLAYLHSKLAEDDAGLKNQFRNSTIQCFEYTFELSHRFIRRYLKEASASPELVDQLGFGDLMREAAKVGLITDPMKFRVYREKRNLTSHVYNEEKATEVLSVVDEFLKDALDLAEQLNKRLVSQDS